MMRLAGQPAALVAVAALLLSNAGAVTSGAASQRPPVVIPYFIADGAGKRGFLATDPELARWALQAWQRSADRLRFEASREDQALVRMYWAEPADGRYGEAQPLVLGDRRGTAVFVRPDTNGLGPEIATRAASDGLLRETIVYLTCLHELGHALGLTHTSDFRDIMYSFGYGGDLAAYFGRYRAQIRSRADIARVSGLSTADIERLRAVIAAQ
jgi:hypothetical protein